jgi:transcriptional regulator with PAS, ATPase and Fis domain
MEEALPLLRKVEGIAQIVLAGPSTRRMYANQLKIPVIAFRPTFPDMIRAIQEAQKIDRRIAICLSRDDREFDLPLLSEVMGVSLFQELCDNSKEYEEACERLKETGYRVVVGGSFTVDVASRIGMEGILLYKGMDMIRSAIGNALELYHVQQEGMRRISQLSAVVDHFSEGLFLTDESGRVILENLPAQKRLGLKSLQGKKVQDLFRSPAADQALKKGQRVLNVIEGKNLVVNYLPVSSTGGIHGLVCTFKRVDEVQDAELNVRERLHHRGFAAKYVMADIIGESRAIRDCKALATRFATVQEPILITGESGTGKELFAHAIHTLSHRSKGPFVAINCATIPNDLLESELFGYEKGAFTGAHTTGKKGLIELAHRGTLFLDEITTLSIPLQAKLLRLLSEREILKLGSDRIIPIDVRILAATNVDMEEFVDQGTFREDLYYRLNVFRLRIPPLRERPEDLTGLFVHFVSRIRSDLVEPLKTCLSTVRRVLSAHELRGNARELENVVRRFCLLYEPEHPEADMDRILDACLEKKKVVEERGGPVPDMRTVLHGAEKKIIEELLRHHKRKADVAKAMHISPVTLWRKMKKHRIESPGD